MSTEPAISVEPAAPTTETPSRRPGARLVGRPARQPGVWLQRLFYDREIVEACYAFHDPQPDPPSPHFLPDPAATDIDAFATALRGLPALEQQQLLEPYLEAAEPCPPDPDRRRGALPRQQALPDAALRTRALGRLLLESDLLLLWRRVGKARYTQTGFREHLSEMPAREFRALLREITRNGEVDEGLARRVGVILGVREEDDRRRAADDWMGARARVMDLVDGEEPGIAVRVEYARDRLTEFRHRHPGYTNISLNQSWADVERYIVDCRQFLERLGIANEHVKKSLAGEVLDELDVIKNWLFASASATAPNGDALSVEQPQLMLQAPGNGTPVPESQDTAPPKSLKRKRAADKVESSPTK
jgi:hypothetical protein